MTADRVRATVGVVGELLITAGVVVGLFAVYTLFWTGVETAGEQQALEREFESTDPEPPEPSVEAAPPQAPPPQATPEPLPGDAYARMRIPRLGEDWNWIVVQGVDLADLTRGPGRYPDSAEPGQVGNFAVAGHRATYGEPFAYLDRLEPGDEIVVEREGQEHLYRVSTSYVTGPDDTAVLAPVPREPGATPRTAVITLTTCHPRWSSEERLIVHGILVGTSSTPTATGTQT